ncbi:hypothetical protein SAMN05428988_1347 [Chitinophaga sp. YR573]|nr:hypothetical protein [Chitinophaga sp. YR573]SEW02276.1 hypothetical protein SAMN05428988_1347 [Chitinophaga sp. YR573]
MHIQTIPSIVLGSIFVLVFIFKILPLIVIPGIRSLLNRKN